MVLIMTIFLIGIIIIFICSGELIRTAILVMGVLFIQEALTNIPKILIPKMKEKTRKEEKEKLALYLLLLTAGNEEEFNNTSDLIKKLKLLDDYQ